MERGWKCSSDGWFSFHSTGKSGLNMGSWKHKTGELNIWKRPILSKISLVVLTKTHLKSHDVCLTIFSSSLSTCPPNHWESIFFQLTYFGTSLPMVENNALIIMRLNYMKLDFFTHHEHQLHVAHPNKYR